MGNIAKEVVDGITYKSVVDTDFIATHDKWKSPAFKPMYWGQREELNGEQAKERYLHILQLGTKRGVPAARCLDLAAGGMVKTFMLNHRMSFGKMDGTALRAHYLKRLQEAQCPTLF